VVAREPEPRARAAPEAIRFGNPRSASGLTSALGRGGSAGNGNPQACSWDG
jgi:hypothetical protein